MHTRYTKLALDLSPLPDDASDHQLVRVEHELLARPLIFTAYRVGSDDVRHAEVNGRAESVTLGGHRFRAPSINEALWIPDRLKYPATPKLFFPDLVEDEYIWTSTVDPDPQYAASVAWGVFLLVGDCDLVSQSGRSSVRAVLAG